VQLFVIPAQAGIQQSKKNWIPACAGMTNKKASDLEKKVAHGVLKILYYDCITLYCLA
jgi:hypothetical protein